MIKLFGASLFLILLLAGCSNKDVEEYNKPAAYWYEKMISSVSDGYLDRADDYYSSLQSEHAGSPLLKEATMILAASHMRQDEFLLGRHFLDEYIKRYANPQEREYAEYMKIVAQFLSLPNPRRDQGTIQDTIAEGEQFLHIHPKSPYVPMVQTILLRLYLGEAALNETIASLYERLDKPTGAEYYRNIKPQEWIDWNKVEPADVPWYREMFEGDGTESWYAFLIPDTQSVVSRRAPSEGNETSAD